LGKEGFQSLKNISEKGKKQGESGAGVRDPCLLSWCGGNEFSLNIVRSLAQTADE